MTYNFVSCAAVATMLLTGCMATTATEEVDPLTARLSGKTGVHASGTTVTLHEDGRITGQTHNGQAIVGAWEVRNGRYCRTITAPESLAGSNCQDVEFDGNKMVFIKDDGTSSTFVAQG
ncbi:hypothetical protein FDP25_16215 [Roseovarius sp. A21]|uniref:Uncharacterized protein n=1 Tax=Roseovarius bejariae TaxID=2576383 RepID=A0A844CY11_9RHOB|nr:hypothetical protein [Roseovarius bejariae]MRU16989.1 hypothetical protein [Roseovarius bejariae]